MRAMVLRTPKPIAGLPLEVAELPTPVPGPGEILVRVEVCGVCRTDLHVAEGDLPPRHTMMIPGHQVVGRVAGVGLGSRRFQVDERVGVPWLYAACGTCRFCTSDRENLCEVPRFTGYDVPGGYAEYLVAREDFVYAIPAELSSDHAAPLLCAGIIGYRALRRSGIAPGGRLGLYGFGASAHIAIQIARHWGCRVYVATRGAGHRDLARSLGARWVGGADEPPPDKLDAAVLFAPVGDLVPVAMAALDKGGTLAVAGIHLTDIPRLNYQEALFQERTLTSVTANTRRDGDNLFRLAREIPITPQTETFPLDRANQALTRLKQDGIQGTGILQVGSPA
jgi:propanol-preferring alcohol dehydrogenase